MLFQQRFHAGIADGSITRSFRVWSRPQVKVGGRYRVGAIGLIEVVGLERVRLDSVSDREARSAGFAGVEELRALLARQAKRKLPGSTRVFRVELRFAGTDDRARPETHDRLEPEGLAELVERVRKLDTRSQHGPWTRATLSAIARRPRVAASRLAPSLDRERLPFKTDVRKLKKLGLTISHEVGYELTDRGRAVLAKLPG